MLEEKTEKLTPSVEEKAPNGEQEGGGVKEVTPAGGEEVLNQGEVSTEPAGRMKTSMREDLEERGDSPEEYEQMLRMYEETLRNIREGDIVTGKVLQVNREEVVVDVGFKSEGIISINEFGEFPNIQVGEEIDVYLESMEDQDGQMVVSKKRADFLKVWDKIREAHETGEVVEGKVTQRIKGGMIVDLYGVDAFLPGSQIDIRQVTDFDQYVGQLLPLKIIKLNKGRRNIVVSRRIVLEELREQQRQKLMGELAEGQIREGVVKNITDFGAFVDLGGMDGLLHITDMSWGRVSHPSEVVAIGDKLKVKILNFDQVRGRVSLGLKQLTPYPWENVEEKYSVGSKVKGRVVSITDYGAFIELEKGVEGLVHISEMSWTQHIKHPSKVVAIGDVVEAVVLRVDKEEEKISLGLRQVEPDPWLTLEQKYPAGSKVVGRVRNLTPFGAFVEVEEGIDGLVHISDMSWTKRIQHPSEVMKKGEKVEVVILNIDKENRRISLGYKQREDNPWPQLSRRYSINSETKGAINRLLDRGVVVELEDGVEGFVPLAQMGKPDIQKPIEAFQEGDVLPLRVTEFDEVNRRIVLSVKEYFEVRERSELERYLAQHPVRSVKMKDMVDRPELEKEETQPEAKRAQLTEAEKAQPKPDEVQSEPEKAQLTEPEKAQPKAEEVQSETEEAQSKPEAG